MSNSWSRLIICLSVTILLISCNSARERDVISVGAETIDNHYMSAGGLYSFDVAPIYDYSKAFEIKQVTGNLAETHLFLDTGEDSSSAPGEEVSLSVFGSTLSGRGTSAPDLLVELTKTANQNSLDCEDPVSFDPTLDFTAFEITNLQTGRCQRIVSPFEVLENGVLTGQELNVCNVYVRNIPDFILATNRFAVKQERGFYIQASLADCSATSADDFAYFSVSIENEIFDLDQTKKAYARTEITSNLSSLSDEDRAQCLPPVPPDDSPLSLVDSLHVCPTTTIFTVLDVLSPFSFIDESLARSQLIINSNNATADSASSNFGYLGYDRSDQSLKFYDKDLSLVWSEVFEADNTFLESGYPIFHQYARFGVNQDFVYIEAGNKLFKLAIENIFGINREVERRQDLATIVFDKAGTDPASPYNLVLGETGSYFLLDNDLYLFDDISTPRLVPIATPTDPSFVSSERFGFGNNGFELRTYTDRQSLVRIDPNSLLENTAAIGKELFVEIRGGFLFVSQTKDDPDNSLIDTTSALVFDSAAPLVDGTQQVANTEFVYSDWIFVENLVEGNYDVFLARIEEADRATDAVDGVLIDPTLFRYNPVSGEIIDEDTIIDTDIDNVIDGFAQMTKRDGSPVRLDRAKHAVYYGADEGTIEIYTNESAQETEVYYVNFMRDCLSDEVFDPGNLVYGVNDDLQLNKDRDLAEGEDFVTRNSESPGNQNCAYPAVIDPDGIAGPRVGFREESQDALNEALGSGSSVTIDTVRRIEFIQVIE